MNKRNDTRRGSPEALRSAHTAENPRELAKTVQRCFDSRGQRTPGMRHWSAAAN